MSGKLIGRGQYTLVHLHDGKSMQMHLHSNVPFIQFFSRHESSFIPDYRSTPIVISPELYFSGSKDNRVDCIKNPTWSINGKEVSEYGGSVSAYQPYSLTISKNIVNDSQLFVDFQCVVVNPDNKVETKIAARACYTKQENAEVSPLLILEYPHGNSSRNDAQPILQATNRLNIGSEDISELATYKWYQLVNNQYVEVEDNLNIFGQDTNTINVVTSSITKTLSFKCVVTYMETTYVNYASFSAKLDTYVCKIANRNGDKMHNGQGSILCEAHMYQGNVMIDDREAEKLFVFTWSKHNKNTGAEDQNWDRRIGRKIEITKDDVDKLATFICEVSRSSNGFPYTIPLVLQ